MQRPEFKHGTAKKKSITSRRIKKRNKKEVRNEKFSKEIEIL
jgi:hypothetical protein